MNAKGYSEILGLKAYKSLDEIADRVDVVVVTVDLKFVPDLLRSAAKKGIHNFVIISGGGKELGGERATIEGQIQRAVKATEDQDYRSQLHRHVQWREPPRLCLPRPCKNDTS